MKYKKIESDNYDIYYIKTSKFKTIHLTTLMIDDYDKDSILKEKLISEFIINTTMECNDEIKMSKKFMDLYNPKIDIYNIYKDYLYRYYDIVFLNEKYTEKGMNKKTIDFYYSILFNPNTVNNKFEEKNFEITKQFLYSEYLKDEEDSSFVAYNNAKKLIKDPIPITIDTHGNKDDFNKLDPKELYNLYKKEITNSKYIIFMVGDINDELINIVKNNLDDKVKKRDINIKTNFEVNESKNITIKTDTSSFNESLLYMIYKIPNITNRERDYVLPIYANIIGGASSKLFNNVREKNSLAYYAYASSIPNQGILYLYAGITNENYEKCLEIMKEQVNDMNNGIISKEEIEGAKNSIYSSILNISDNIYQIQNNLENVILYKKKEYNLLKKEFKSVSKKELIDLSNKLNLDIVYFLKGGTNE